MYDVLMLNDVRMMMLCSATFCFSWSAISYTKYATERVAWDTTRTFDSTHTGDSDALSDSLKMVNI